MAVYKKNPTGGGLKKWGIRPGYNYKSSRALEKVEFSSLASLPLPRSESWFRMSRT